MAAGSRAGLKRRTLWGVRTAIVLFALLAAPAVGEPEGADVALPRSPGEAGVGRLVAADAVPGLRELPRDAVLVVAMTSTACPLSRKIAPALARLEAAWTPRGVRFVFVDVDGADTAADFDAFAAAHGFKGARVHDPDRRVAAALGAETTTEAFVIDGARTLRYRGAVDDRYGLTTARDAARHAYLADALEAVLGGREPAVAATTAPGCVLGLDLAADAAPTTLTWHGDISRIVQRSCMECHREGGVAPFALETREQVDARAGMIRHVVKRGLMPPWFAAPQPDGEPSPWANDRSLAARDRAALLQWLESDRPAGDPADAPLPKAWPKDWTIGEPDAVFELPHDVAVKAEGLMPYVDLEVPTEFPEDRWIQAWEVRPTAPDVVHHVLVFAIPPDADRRTRETAGFFAAYVPGNSAATYAPGLGKRLPKGATLLFQLHYTPNGTARTDRTRLALRFAPGPPRNEVFTIGVFHLGLRIPPGAPDHAERGMMPVLFDVDVLGLMPHMHYRGKAFRYEVIPPAGRRTTLLDVPRYDFNWQLAYRFREPVPIEAGSLITVEGRFDNSADNPANPDPAKEVRWGPQTTDEMLIGYVEYVARGVNAGDRPRPAPGGVRGQAKAEMVLRRLDKDGDERVSLEEVPQPLRHLFKRMDEDGDGLLDRDEIARSGPLSR